MRPSTIASVALWCNTHQRVPIKSYTHQRGPLAVNKLSPVPYQISAWVKDRVHHIQNYLLGSDEC